MRLWRALLSTTRKFLFFYNYKWLKTLHGQNTETVALISPCRLVGARRQLPKCATNLLGPSLYRLRGDKGDKCVHGKDDKGTLQENRLCHARFDGVNREGLWLLYRLYQRY